MMDAPPSMFPPSVSEALALRLLLAWQAENWETYRKTLAEINEKRCALGMVNALVWEIISNADSGWAQRTQDRLAALLDAERPPQR